MKQNKGIEFVKYITPEEEADLLKIANLLAKTLTKEEFCEQIEFWNKVYNRVVGEYDE